MTTSDLYLQEIEQPTRTIRRIHDNTNETRAEKALKHISDGWFPTQAGSSDKFKKIVAEASHDRSNLIEVVRHDPALFAHVSSKLRSFSLEQHSPLEALTKIPDEKLHLLTEGLDRTPHKIDKATPLQRMRNGHTVTAAVAAESIAEKLSLPAEHAYTASQFTELGHNLIAWNYPHLYSQAMSRQKRLGEDINESLERLVGISPARVGARFASEWGISREVTNALRDGAKQTPQSVFRARLSGPSLSDVCRIADYFAQTKQLQYFPRGLALWENERKALEPFLGKDALQEIVERVDSIVAQYLEVPAAQEQAEVVERDAPASSVQAEQLFLANTFAQRLNKDLQKNIVGTYELMQSGEVSPRAIADLAHRVANELQFNRGCLYLLGEHGKLNACLRIGDAPSLSALDNYLKSLATMFSGSLYCRMPYRCTAFGMRGNKVMQVVGSLDHSAYDGVLYLESDNLDPELPLVLNFQAYRRALAQGLGDK